MGGGYTYTPAYYSSLQDSITSICKNILPFSLKKRRLLAAERKQSKEQADNLKWQQESFHHMLNLMGLRKEGIVQETEVATYRSKLLETLIISRLDHEQPVIIRDKLRFLQVCFQLDIVGIKLFEFNRLRLIYIYLLLSLTTQELLYAKCISMEEYHASKRPLLQRLATQGEEIEARDVILGDAPKENSNVEEEWSEIDLRDEKCLLTKEKNSNSKSKGKIGSAAIKSASSVLFGFGSSDQKHGRRNREEKSIFEANNPPIAPVVSSDEKAGNQFWDKHLKKERDEGEEKSILMAESLTPESDKYGAGNVERKGISDLFKNLKDGDSTRAGKKQWGLEGIKKWKRSGSNVKMKVDRDEAGRSPVEEQGPPDTKQTRRNLLLAHDDGWSSASNIKNELKRIQTELSHRTNHQNLRLANDQIEAISTKLPPPVHDKAAISNYHAGEMENIRNTTRQGRDKHTKTTTRWATFEDDENYHPNLFAPEHQSEVAGHEKHRSESAFYHDSQNPFWSPSS